MATSSSDTVDRYIASQPEALQTLLHHVRDAIRKALPGAEEGISYRIPTYKLKGKPVLYFAGWKQHYSLYPVSQQIVTAIDDGLVSYTISKSTIRFPLTQPVPVQFIERIATHRAGEVAKD